MSIAGIDGVGGDTLEGVELTVTYYDFWGNQLPVAPIDATGNYCTAVVSFAGSADDQATTSSAILCVTTVDSLLTLSLDGTTIHVGDTVTVTATVTPASSNVNGTPAGLVAFFCLPWYPDPPAPQLVDGVATWTFTISADWLPGDYTIFASYQPNTNPYNFWPISAELAFTLVA